MGATEFDNGKFDAGKFDTGKSSSKLSLIETWFLQGGLRFGKFKVSRLGGNDNYLAPDPEDLKKILALIRQRQRLEAAKPVEDTVVVGSADFQPVAFMKEGATRSRAVCRIAREFSLPEFRHFIETIQHRDDLRSFNSVSKLIDIFSIPDQIVQDIFVNIQERVLKNPILTDLPPSIQSGISQYVTPLKQQALNDLQRYGSVDLLQKQFNNNYDIAEAVFKLGYLEALKEIDASILAKLNPLPVGTGFLVGGNHILTNQHVIPDATVAEQCITQFSYVQDARGYTQASIDYGLSPRDLFISNPELDYTLVQLNTGQFTRQAGYDFGWITIAEDEEDITPGWFAINPQATSISPDQIKVKLEQYIKDSPKLKEKIRKSLNSQDEQQLKKVLDELNQDIQINVENSYGKLVVLVNHPFLTQKDLDTLLIGDQYTQRNIAALLKSPPVTSAASVSAGLTSSDSTQPSEATDPTQRISAVIGDKVFIIQHPRGQEQQIVLSDNSVLPNGLYHNFLRYRADSDYGSSGSPVFNEKWQLVALHHAAIGELNLADVTGNTVSTQEATSSGQPVSSSSAPQIYAQQGVRICRILEDLKQKSLSQSKLRNFIDDFAVTTEQLNYPPLPAALEFDGVRSYVGVDAEVAVSFAGTRQDGSVDLVEWSKGGLQLSQISIATGEVTKGEKLGNRVWLSQDGQHIAVLGQKITTKDGDRYPIELRDRTDTLLHTFTDQPAPVTCANFSPDDHTLAIGCKDGSIRVWDCQKGKLLASLLHTNGVLDITFSPDGKTLVASSPDEALLVCQQTENQWSQPKKRILEGGHVRHSVRCCNVSPDGKTFASGDEEGWVKLWDTETGQLRCTLPPQGAKVSQLIFSADNRYLACVLALLSDEGFAVKIWELADKHPPQLLGSKEKDVAQVVLTQVQVDVQSFTVATYLSKKTGTLTLETLQGALIHQLGGTHSQIGISPDGQTLLTLALMKPVWESDPEEYRQITGQIADESLSDVETHTAKIWGLRWEKDTSLKVTVTEIDHPLTQQTRIAKALFSPKSRQIVAAVFDLPVPVDPNQRTWSLKRWNLSGDTKEQVLLRNQSARVFTDFMLGIGFGSNQTDEFLAVASYEKAYEAKPNQTDQSQYPSSIQLWSSTATQPTSLPWDFVERWSGNTSYSYAEQIVFSPDAQVLIAATRSQIKARLWQLVKTENAITVIATKDEVIGVSYNETRVFASTTHLFFRQPQDLKIKIWEISQFFANSSQDAREFSLWNRNDSSYDDKSYSMLPLAPTKLSFNPTGDMLGAVNSGGSFTTWNFGSPSWDLATNQPTRTFQGLQSSDDNYSFRSVQLSPDGDIITTVAPNRVRVWNIEGEKLGIFQDIGSYAEVAVSPDSHLIVTVDSSQVKICDRSGNVLYEGTSNDLYDAPYYTKIAITPDSQVIIIAGNQTIQCWDRRGKELYKQTYDDQVFGKNTTPTFSFVPTLTSDYPPPPIMAVQVSNHAYTASQIILYEWIVRGKDVQVTPLLKNPIPGADAVGFSHDGTKLVTGDCSNEFNDEDRTFNVTATLTVWDIKTGQLQVTSPLIPIKENLKGGHYGKTYINQISFSPDDAIVVYALGQNAGEGSSVHPPVIYLWRWQEPGTNPISLKHSHRNEDPAWDYFHFGFSPNHQHLVAIDRTAIEVWNRKAGWGELVEGLREQPNRGIRDTQFMPDGKAILFIEDTSVKRWNLEHGQSQVIATHSDQITDLAINENGTTIATASVSRIVKLWDSQGNLKKTLGDIHLANSLSFFSASTLLTSGKEGVIKVWKRTPGSLPYTVEAEKQCHDAEVLAMSVKESATLLASAGQEGTVKFWRVSPAKADQPMQIGLLKLPPMQLPFSQQGYAGGHLRLNPAHQQLNTLTDIYSFSGDRPFSIEAWVNLYPDGFGGTVIGKWREDNEGEYRLSVTARGTVLFSRLAPESFQQVYTVESSLRVPFGQFHHLAAIYKGKVMQLYINGQLDQQTFTFLENGKFETDESDRLAQKDGKRQDPQTYFRTNDDQIFQLTEPTSDNKFKLQLNKGNVEKNNDLKIFKAGPVVFSFDVVPPQSDTSSTATGDITYQLLGTPTFETESGQRFSVEKVVRQGNRFTIWTNGLIAGDQREDLLTPVLIGAHFNDPANVKSPEQVTTGFFKGIIAEVRIWNEAISADQIQKYRYRRLNPAEKPNLIGYWRFEEGMGDRITNLANPPANGMLIPSYGKVLNAKWLNASQFPTLPLPFSLKFNGEDAYVDCGNVPQLTEAITVEAWVKHSYGDGLIVHRGGGWEENGYSLFWYRGKIRVELQDTSRQTKLTIDTQENAPSDNTWHHIAFTWTENLLDEQGNPNRDKQGNLKKIQEVEMYIDGRRQNVIAVSGESKSILSGGLYKSVGIFKGAIGEQKVPLTIAGLAKKEANGKKASVIFFDGAIAEVRLWKVARTQNEIKANLYRRLDVTQETNLVGYWRLDEEVTVQPSVTTAAAQTASSAPVATSLADSSSNKKVRDLTSNNFHGAVHRANWFPTAGDASTNALAVIAPPISKPSTGQPSTGQPSTGQPPTNQLPTVPPPTNQPPTSQPPANQSPTDPPSTGQSPTDSPPTSQPPTNQPPTSQPPTNQPPTDPPSTGQSPTDSPPTSQPPTNQPPTSQPPTNQPPTDPPSTGQSPTDPPSTGQLPTDSPPTSQPPTNQPPTSQPPTSQPPANQPPTNQPPTNQPPTNQPPISQPPTPTPQFEDLKTHWAKDRILALANRSIVKGYPDRSFKPDRPMNRAEFTAILVTAFNPVATSPAVTFSDVPTNFWAWAVIQQVYASGLMVGIPGNQFGPDLNVTRLQTVIVLVNSLIKQQKPLPQPDQTTLRFFTDINTLKPAAQHGIAIAAQLGIIAKPASPSQFRPDDPATRAEVTAMVLQALSV